VNQEDGTAGGSRSSGDAEAWRTLFLGILERFDVLAAGLLGEQGAAQTGDPDGPPRQPGQSSAADFAGAARIALDGIIEEAGELLWQLLGQLIAILEAIQAALEQMIGVGGTAPAPRGAGETGRDAAYQPITVHFQPAHDNPRDRS
jgi:hypothetical protein